MFQFTKNKGMIYGVEVFWEVKKNTDDKSFEFF